MKRRYNLTAEEKKIEDEIDTYRSVTGEKRKKVESIIAGAKKNKAISLRISNYDLEKLKEKAEQEGLPYQTLITTVLHKYITNQLFEKDEIIKSFRLLKEERAI
ncbi:CopG family antitoxin [Marispirochaeta aestuarii]|uniref:CopG family antitoxin n=1 Tax=Marispirochaeta aestuarii TaxID=1963862 RepID=UPI0029C84033|nr:CopG family antitoxin [Marispirochaeta aestuarii]